VARLEKMEDDARISLQARLAPFEDFGKAEA
jgi:hypothetical protein